MMTLMISTMTMSKCGKRFLELGSHNLLNNKCEMSFLNKARKVPTQICITFCRGQHDLTHNFNISTPFVSPSTQIEVNRVEWTCFNKI